MSVSRLQEILFQMQGPVLGWRGDRDLGSSSQGHSEAAWWKRQYSGGPGDEARANEQGARGSGEGCLSLGGTLSVRRLLIGRHPTPDAPALFLIY